MISVQLSSSLTTPGDHDVKPPSTSNGRTWLRILNANQGWSATSWKPVKNVSPYEAALGLQTGPLCDQALRCTCLYIEKPDIVVDYADESINSVPRKIAAL